MKNGILIVTSVFLLGFSFACSGSPDKKDMKTGAAANNKAFHKTLMDIAKSYKKSYGEVNPRPNWAPTMCWVPPTQALFSKSKETTTHGQKLYYLFAKKGGAYLRYKKGDEVKEGQVLVKESWTPVEQTAKDKAKAGRFDRASPLKDGKRYVTGKQKELFIMAKLDPKTPGTDQGWIYGTVTPDGKTVTSAGLVQSCMKCHVKVKDRLFGPAKSQSRRK